MKKAPRVAQKRKKFEGIAQIWRNDLEKLIFFLKKYRNTNYEAVSLGNKRRLIRGGFLKGGA